MTKIIKNVAKLICATMAFAIMTNPLQPSNAFTTHLMPQLTPVVIIQTYTRNDLKCLTDNIYFEAGNQTDAGKMAVAIVTLARTKSKRYSNDLCEVVYQNKRKHGRLVCQYSWTCTNVQYPKNNIELKAFHDSYNIAKTVLEKIANDFDYSTAPTHYHADYAFPSWRKSAKMVKIARIGSHIFYREII